jgi:predicted dehydrogenase
MNGNDSLSRRGFLAASLGGLAWTPTRHRARGRITGANEQVAVGIIGVGRRGDWAAEQVVRCGGQLAALCDVLPSRLQQAHQYGWYNASRVGTIEDYRCVLGRRDVDAVVIATPDCWHHRILMDAVSAGKHVYLETPVSRTVDEAREMARAVQESGCVVQVGHQHRSSRAWQRARQEIAAGRIGQVEWIQMGFRRRPQWRPVNQRDADLPPKFLFGPCSRCVDASRWVLDLPTCRSVVAVGGFAHRGGLCPAGYIHAVFDYGEAAGILDVVEPDADCDIHVTFHGTGGQLRCDRDPEAETAHVRNWLDCIRAGRTPNAPIDAALNAMIDVHLASVAQETARRVEWGCLRRRARAASNA